MASGWLNTGAQGQLKKNLGTRDHLGNIMETSIH